jgi:cystathionine beta-lyase/cystathionine gamma-synthase
MNPNEKIRKYSRETFLVHGLPYDAHWEYGHHVVPPITASTTFRLDSTQRGADGFASFAAPVMPGPEVKPIYIYDRLGEPTVALLENALCEIEGGESATAFASGMAAISAVFLSLCPQGSEVIAHKTMYGCTYSLLTNWLPRFGVRVHLADLNDPETLPRLLNRNTRVVYFESPVNPTLEVLDIKALSSSVHKANRGRKPAQKAYVVVDNTFATPYCQRPLSLGADIVVHSLTKNIMGFGTDMGGIVIAPMELHSLIRLARKDIGGMVAPRAAWNILVYGINSLHIRMEKQMANARRVAAFLENRKEVARVSYPGLKSHPQHALARKQMRDFRNRFAPGLMIYFELAGKGTQLVAAARRFMDHIAAQSYTLTLAVSLGQAKTLIEAPVLMTHCAYGDEAKKAGICAGGIRLSLGIEDVSDVIRDLKEAFARI